MGPIFRNAGAFFMRRTFKGARLYAKVFSEYVKKFPRHENQEQAREFIALINQRLEFNRYDIGCLLPLSGSHSAFGMRALRGIKLALNTYHSLHKEIRLNLIVQDSQSDEQNAVKGIQTLNKKNVNKTFFIFYSFFLIVVDLA